MYWESWSGGTAGPVNPSSVVVGVVVVVAVEGNVCVVDPGTTGGTKLGGRDGQPID